VCDDLRGAELTREEWCTLVDTMAGRGLEEVRIAHVKPSGLAQIEYCELCAREAGFDARAFADLAEAERWLRYGESGEHQATDSRPTAPLAPRPGKR
jgi:hypothetical protein